VTAGLRAWQQQQQQQQVAAAAATPTHDTAADASLVAVDPASRVPASPQTAAAQLGSVLGDLLPAAALADCAGGILSAVEAASGGQGAGEMLAPEPELLMAAARRGEPGGGGQGRGGCLAATACWTRNGEGGIAQLLPRSRCSGCKLMLSSCVQWQLLSAREQACDYPPDAL
jgi:hypothetical protein